MHKIVNLLQLAGWRNDLVDHDDFPEELAMALLNRNLVSAWNRYSEMNDKQLKWPTRTFCMVNCVQILFGNCAPI